MPLRASSTSSLSWRSQQLARLSYELLDAHLDTAQLVHEGSGELEWRAHLSYLRDLQRRGREILAQAVPPANPNDGPTAAGTSDA